jgi:hypothetical protein
VEDFKEIIYFALSLAAAVIIITLMTLLNSQTEQMAAIRHEDYRARQMVIEARRYGEYHGQELNGVEVIALVRENAVNRGECIIRVYNRDGIRLFIMDENNHALFTYEALTDRYSPIRIEPDARFLASVEDTHREIALLML